MSRNETKFFLLYIIWAICLVILTAGCDLQASQVDTGCSVCAAAPSRIKICSSNGTWIFRRCGHDQYCINEDLNCNAYCAPGCLSLDGSFFAKGRELCNHNSSAKIVCGDNGRWLSEPCAVQGRCGWLGGSPICRCVLPGERNFGKSGCSICTGANELSVCQADGSLKRQICDASRTCVQVAHCIAQCGQPCEDESKAKVKSGCRRCDSTGKSELICNWDGTWHSSNCNSTTRCYTLGTCVTQCSDHQLMTNQAFRRICGRYIIVETETTCSALANKYDITMEDLELLNQNLSCNGSLAGQHVCVQFFNPRFHCGQSVLLGFLDTCGDLLNNYNISLKRLLTLNPKLNCQNVIAGQQICVKSAEDISESAYTTAPDYSHYETETDFVSDFDHNKLVYITLICAALMILGLVVVVATLAYKNRSRSRNMRELELDLMRSNKEMDPITPLFEQLENLSFDSRYELPLECLKIDRKNVKTLGKGHFGRVVEASLINPDGSETSVAIKRTRSNWDVNQYRILFEELCILVNVGSHPNVISLLGAVTQISRGHLYVVLELCSNGSLLDYIRKVGKEKFVNEIVPHQTLGEVYERQLNIVRNESLSLSTSDLLSFGYQIANGMEWVASRGFIHRDLAARNILLTIDLMAKISDFGLGRQEYYFVEKDKSLQLPLRWSAPEAILHRKFSVNSDIWSFGLLLGELFSLGCIPFPEISQLCQKFATQLSQGNIPLPKPQYARQPIHTLMVSCCNPTPKLRCNFEICKEKLLREFQLCNPDKTQDILIRLQNAAQTLIESEKVNYGISRKSKNSGIKTKMSQLFKLTNFSKSSSPQLPTGKSNYVPFSHKLTTCQYETPQSSSGDSMLSDTNTITSI